MSGLETAIRNALSRSERGDAATRARIYQTARQALDAGLTRQAVTDPAVIEAERQRLEAKIREIESEEKARDAERPAPASPAPASVPPTSVLPVEVPPASAPQPSSPAPVAAKPAPAAAPISSQAPSGSRPMRIDPVLSPAIDPEPTGEGVSAPLHEVRRAEAPKVDVRTDAARPDGAQAAVHAEPRLDGATRLGAGEPEASPLTAGDGLADLGAMSGERRNERLGAAPAGDRKGRAGKAKASRGRKGQAQTAAESGDFAPGIPGEKRKRRRRGVFSRLFIWLTMLTFIVMGGWWAWTSGLFLTAAQRDTSVPNPPATVSEEDFSGAAPGTPSGFDPQHGFSSDWLEVYGPNRKAAAAAGASATVETVAMADGPALRITSTSPSQSGDVAIEVPVDVLRELSGKTSTIALTLQSAADSSVQVAVRCDFSSLGDCARHRIAASQERADSLFRVTFDRTLAPTQPGRIYINSDILGGRSSIYLFSVRVLPGQ
ncbi:hypothetical protein J2858_001063 [Neorhizobium galegae]|uniref:hypothetical protein n=1 Tax=Neorhizobium galegae TaxID=399 RepID=UPI001AE22913|nr:hypothetical protein [Neorhizobium galegae]